MVRRWVVLNLRRCARAGIRHGRVDLGGCRTRGSSDCALGAWSGTSGALRRLAREAVWGRSLLVRLCERRLLRGRRWWGRGPLETRRRLHLMRRSRGCLLLLGRRLRRETSLAASGHDAREEVVAGPD